MRRWLVLLTVVVAGIAMAATPAAGKSANGTATVPDGTTIADGHSAAAAAAKTACASNKGAKTARIVVGAGAITVSYSFKCADVAAVTTTKAPPVTKPPAGPIFTQSGSGTATTGSFKVPSRWDLQWSYDCSGFLGGTGNFIVSIYDDYGENSQLDLDNQGVNQLGAAGNGVERYHSGGNTKFLKVVSECNWTVTVTKP